MAKKTTSPKTSLLAKEKHLRESLAATHVRLPHGYVLVKKANKKKK